MLEMLAMTGLLDVHLDLGHVGIYRALAKQAELTPTQESELFDILQRKARPELAELMDSYSIASDLKTLFLTLPTLNGDREILNKAKTIFAHANDEAQQALAELTAIADKLAARFPSLPISFDLAELRGYHYHTGMVFAAFIPIVGREIARGGRYDNIGAVFGRARPATGFSADLKLLASLSKKASIKPQRALIFAPCVDDAALCEKIRALRAEHQAVVQQLPEQTGTAQDLGCTAILEFINQQWVIRPL
jgi:ATP phosphoribosyltransferase regulatory subunit